MKKMIYWNGPGWYAENESAAWVLVCVTLHDFISYDFPITVLRYFKDYLSFSLWIELEEAKIRENDQNKNPFQVYRNAKKNADNLLDNITIGDLRKTAKIPIIDCIRLKFGYGLFDSKTLVDFVLETTESWSDETSFSIYMFSDLFTTDFDEAIQRSASCLQDGESGIHWVDFWLRWAVTTAVLKFPRR